MWSDWIYMKYHEILSYSHAWSFKQQIVTHGPQTPCNNPSNHNALGTCSDTFIARFVGEICGSNAKRAFAEFSTRPGPRNDDLGDTAVLRAAASPSHKRWIAKMNKGYIDTPNQQIPLQGWLLMAPLNYQPSGKKNSTIYGLVLELLEDGAPQKGKYCWWWLNHWILHQLKLVLLIV